MAIVGYIRRNDMAVKVQYMGQTITVEKKCSTCAFGSLDEDTEPCMTCFASYTPEEPYTQWKFDENEYDPEEDVF